MFKACVDVNVNRYVHVLNVMYMYGDCYNYVPVTRGNLGALRASVPMVTKCHFGSSLLHDKAKCTLEMMVVAIDKFVAQCILVIFAPVSHHQTTLSSWK